MDLMLRDGLIKEAQDVITFRTHHALKTVGYKEVYDFLDGMYDQPEMIRLLKQNSRRYAKRQLTWFRHQGNFRWFAASQFDEIHQYVTTTMQ